MTENVTATEIADLMHHLHCLHEHRPIDPVDQAAVLALKAELLARIADQHAEGPGPSNDTTEVRAIADEAKAIAANASRLVRLHHTPPGGAKSQENPPPF